MRSRDSHVLADPQKGAVRVTWRASGAHAPCAAFFLGPVRGRHQPSDALAAARLFREFRVAG
jgi:hypothetical protein